MLAALLFVAAAMALIVVLLLTVVIAGIRQEPADEMTSRAPRATAALARRLLGVYVRRPDAQDVDGHRCSCLAGHGSERDGQ